MTDVPAGYYTVVCGRLAKVGLPLKIQRQPGMQCDPLYMLPMPILDHLHSSKKRPALDSHSFQTEKVFTLHCEEHKIVGYSGGRPVTYDLLEDPDRDAEGILHFVNRYAELKGRLPLQRGERARAQKRLAGVARARRGYAGWLVTNQAFRAELDRLVSRWKPQIQKHGLPGVGLHRMACLQERPRTQSKHDQYLRAFAEFCVRWRLEGLAALELPVPLGPHLPIAEPKLLLRQMQAGGFSYFLPDTYPVPSREELREIGLQSQAVRAPKHLAQWIRVVRRQSGLRGGVRRYGQLLALRHYWTALQSRRPEIFHRNKRHIATAIGSFLDMSAETVRKRLREI